MGQTKIFRGWFRPLLCSALNHVVTARTCWNLHFLTRFPVFYCGVCVRLFFSHLFFVFCFVTRSRTEQKRTHGMPRCDAFVCKCAPTGWWSSSRLKSSRSSHRIVFFFQMCGRLGGFRVGWGAMTFLMLQLQWQTWNEGPPEDRGSPMRIIIPVMENEKESNHNQVPFQSPENLKRVFYQGQPSVASSISEEIRELWLGFVWKSQTWPKIHVWHIFGGINIPLFQTFGV